MEEHKAAVAAVAAAKAEGGGDEGQEDDAPFEVRVAPGLTWGLWLQ